MKPVTRQNLYLALNSFIFVTMVVAVIVTLTIGSRASRLDNLEIPYWEHVVTFTILSNIFLGIVALIAAIFGFRELITKKQIPKALSTWYLVAATAGLVTCFTVIFFLAPMRGARGQNYFDMLLEPMFFLHFLNPILAALTYVCLLPHESRAKHPLLLATLPVVIYAIPYIFFVVILKIVPDFYGVTFGGRYYLTPLVFVAFWLLAFAPASLLTFTRHKINSKI